MPARVPIYTKIIILFGINLLVIGVVGALVLRQQLSADLNTMLGQQVSNRLTEISKEIREEVHQLGTATWDEALSEFGERHHVELYLFNVAGKQFAGKPVELPPEVIEQLRRPGAEDGEGPGEGAIGNREPRPTPRESGGAPGMERGRRPGPGPNRTFFVRSSHPAGYWFGTRLPINPPRSSRPEPGVLLARTSGMFGSGVLIDLWPWFWTAGGVLLLSALLWLPLVRDLTGSVKQMTRAAEQIAEGRFDVAVNERRRDELGRLGSAINQMTRRLDGFVTGQKRFLGDTAHELCAPIARMQMALGILEQRAGDASQKYVQDVYDELQHMSDLVSELMSLSKAGLARQAIELREVQLKPLLDALLRRETNGRVPAINRLDEQVAALAEPDLLSRAIANILRNSVRYGGDQNRITVTGRKDDAMVELVITDTGPGIPEDELLKIFDPFYRVDRARTPGEGGTGLGLAIVKTCITACEGTVEARNHRPNGLEVIIRLPAAGNDPQTVD